MRTATLRSTDLNSSAGVCEDRRRRQFGVVRRGGGRRRRRDGDARLAECARRRHGQIARARQLHVVAATLYTPHRRGVGGSCAEHLTVESYKIIISLQSYFYYWYSITHSLFHSRLKSFLFYRSLSFVSFKIHYMDFPDCLLLLLSISVFLLFSFFSVFTLF